MQKKTHTPFASVDEQPLHDYVNAEIPINQQTFPFSRDNDIPCTDITMKNTGIKESTIMHCNRQNVYSKQKVVIG